MRPALALMAAAAATVALAACNADVSQSDDREPVPDRVRAGLATLYAGPSASPQLQAEGECFATALADRLTLDEMVDAGVVRDDGEAADDVPMLDVDVASTWVFAAGSCAPYVEVAARTAAERSPGLDRATFVACLSSAMTANRLREALVATLTGHVGTDPAAVELAEAEKTCAAAG